LDSWAIKLPWTNMCLWSNGLLHNVKCKICNQVEGKDKLFAPKWESLCKHTSRKKAKNIYWFNEKGVVVL
jgi:hypothetical protein